MWNLKFMAEMRERERERERGVGVEPGGEAVEPGLAEGGAGDGVGAVEEMRRKRRRAMEKTVGVIGKMMMTWRRDDDDTLVA